MKQSYKDILLQYLCITIMVIIVSFFLIIFTLFFMPPFNCELIQVNSTTYIISSGLRGLR